MNLKHKVIGATMIEYILGLSILVIALSVTPIPGTGGLSAVELLEQSLKGEYTEYSKSIASPR